MSDRTYNRIANALLLLAIACSLLTQKYHTWYLVFGLIAITAALGAILLHFKYGSWQIHTFESVTQELAQGLRDGSVVLRKKAHISVTQELIDRDGHACTACPVFNAMEAAGVPVKAVHFYTWLDRNHKSWNLPEAVGNWIWHYDAFDGTPQPFEFDIEWEA